MITLRRIRGSVSGAAATAGREVALQLVPGSGLSRRGSCLADCRREQ
jgi:hypothetical protein